LILKLIAEGRTNAAIADVLGYSESLIRQETIKIYAKLGCSGRNEAAQIYNRMHSQNASVAV
jgi:DNA-binding CsgD family transcriptional regulator